MKSNSCSKENNIDNSIEHSINVKEAIVQLNVETNQQGKSITSHENTHTATSKSNVQIGHSKGNATKCSVCNISIPKVKFKI